MRLAGSTNHGELERISTGARFASSFFTAIDATPEMQKMKIYREIEITLFMIYFHRATSFIRVYPISLYSRNSFIIFCQYLVSVGWLKRLPG